MRNYVIPPNHEGGYVYTRGYSHQGDERGSQILQIVIISLLIIFARNLPFNHWCWLQVLSFRLCIMFELTRHYQSLSQGGSGLSGSGPLLALAQC